MIRKEMYSRRDARPRVCTTGMLQQTIYKNRIYYDTIIQPVEGQQEIHRVFAGVISLHDVKPRCPVPGYGIAIGFAGVRFSTRGWYLGNMRFVFREQRA